MEGVDFFYKKLPYILLKIMYFLFLKNIVCADILK